MKIFFLKYKSKELNVGLEILSIKTQIVEDYHDRRECSRVKKKDGRKDAVQSEKETEKTKPAGREQKETESCNGLQWHADDGWRRYRVRNWCDV